MHEVDARNHDCPEPVMMTKLGFKKLQPGQNIRILVDNETAMNNVKRALQRLNTTDLTALKKADNLFEITAIKAEVESKKIVETDYSSAKPEFYLITRATFGQKTEGLGVKLMDSFLGVIYGEEPKPAGIFLLNQAVKLACEGSPTIDILKKLVDKGIPLMACGLCLKDQGLTEKLRVGKISAMPDLVDAFKNFRVINIG